MSKNDIDQWIQGLLVIVLLFQIQDDIVMNFCSTEEIHEDGCNSASLVCLGSTVHLLIGVSLMLNLQIMIFIGIIKNNKIKKKVIIEKFCVCISYF